MKHNQALPEKKAASSGKTQTKKVKEKRGPNPFNIFMKERAPLFRAENPTINHTEIPKTLGNMWKSMTNEEKEVSIESIILYSLVVNNSNSIMFLLFCSHLFRRL